MAKGEHMAWAAASSWPKSQRMFDPIVLYVDGFVHVGAWIHIWGVSHPPVHQMLEQEGFGLGRQVPKHASAVARHMEHAASYL